MPASITIELKGLRFFAQHGWHEEEALTGNEFEITVLALFPAVDNLTSLYDTVDYTKVYALIKTIFSEREQLLETVAQKITIALKREHQNIQHLRLTITKLNPPIASFIGTVGITYTEDFK